MAAASFLGARAADHRNAACPGIAEAMAGDCEDVEAVLGAWELWRHDRAECDRPAR